MYPPFLSADQGLEQDVDHGNLTLVIHSQVTMK